jgi:hypothetical protein
VARQCPRKPVCAPRTQDDLAFRFDGVRRAVVQKLGTRRGQQPVGAGLGVNSRDESVGEHVQIEALGVGRVVGLSEDA